MLRSLSIAASTAAAVFLAACASGGGGPVVIPPQPVTPGPSGASAPPLVPVRPYGSGSPTYVVTTTASIRADADTAAATADSVETTFIAHLLLERGGNRLFVSGTIDSFTVRGTGRVAGAPPAGPLRFRGEGSAFGERMTFVPDLPASCDSPAEALLATARDLIVPLPDRVTAGAMWRDTVTATVCRGGVALTTTAVRQYVARGLAPHAGEQALELARTTELTVVGSGSQHGQSVSVTGQGSGTTTLFVDPGGGGLLGSTAETTAALSFTGPRGTTTFTQTSRQRIERR